MHFKRPQDARAAGIETVYQNLAVSPALDVAANLFLGREVRKKGILGSVFRVVDQKGMRQKARDELQALGISTLQDVTVPVENLSGGQRQAVAVARAAAFGSKVVVLDEPTAALGVRESNQVLELIKNLRDRGIPVILISHNMPQVFDVADRIHIQRLGKRAATITPESHSMTDAVAIMTGAATRMSWSSDDRPGRAHRPIHRPARARGGGRSASSSRSRRRCARSPDASPSSRTASAPAPSGSGVTAEPEPVGTGFVVVEAYRDEEAFAAHLAADVRRRVQRGARAAHRGGRIGAHLHDADRLSRARSAARLLGCSAARPPSGGGRPAARRAIGSKDMNRRARPSMRPGPRRSLTHAEILAAAFDLLEAKGFAAVSVRGVAGSLGITPTALYTYYPSKRALLRGMIEHLLARLDVSTTDGDEPVEVTGATTVDGVRARLVHVALAHARAARPGTRAPSSSS